MSRQSLSDDQKRRAFEHAGKVWALVQAASNRALATDGPVSPEYSELSESEYRDLERHANAIAQALMARSMAPATPRRRFRS